MLLASWLNGLKSRISGRILERSVVSPRRQRRPVARSVNSLEPRTLLAAVMWDGGGGDFQWNNPLNWDTDMLPGAADDVTIDFGANDFTVVHSGGTNLINRLTSAAALDISGGTLLVNSASTVDGDLQLSGTLGGSADIDVSGLFTWNNGSLVGVGGKGSLTASGGTVIVANNFSEVRGGFRYLNPAGQTATWTGNRAIILSDRSIFQNDGTLDLQQSGAGIGDRDDMSEFINTGTVLKSQSAGESYITTGVIINSGLIDVQSGDFYFGYYELSQTTNTGTIHGALDTTIWVFSGLDSSGTIDADRVQFLHGTQLISGEFAANDTQVYRSDVTMTGTIASLGALGVDGGTLNLTAATFMSGGETFDSLNLNGTLVTDEDLTVAGMFTWNNGSLVGVGGHGSLNISQDTILGSNLTVRNFTLINAANMTWTGGTVQFFGTTGGFINATGATFTTTFDGTFGSVDGNCLRFVNDGQFIKSGNAGITYLRMQLYNRGIVEIQQGQLYLGCGYVSNNPGNPPAAGIDYPADHPPAYENDDPVVIPPGVVPGSYTQTVNGLLIEQIAGHSGGTYGTPGTDYGQLVVNGNVALNGSFEVEVIGGFVPSLGQQYMAINNLGSQPIAGTFIGLPEGSIVWAGNYGFSVSYVGGNGNDFVLTMSQFANSPPQANAGGPYSVAEGGTVILSAAGSSDAQQSSASLTYAWDLDGDGIFGETGLGAERGNENVMEPVFSAAGLNGPSVYTVQLRVTDEFGEFDVTSATISILNVAPLITLTGAMSANEGQTKSYSFTTIDPGADVFSVVAISGGVIGTVSNVVFDSATGIGSFDVTFPDGAAVSTVSIQLQDSDGALSNVAALNVAVANVAPTLTSLTSSNGSLAHVSTNGNVTIHGSFFDPAQSFDTHTVLINWGDGTATETLPAAAINQSLDTFLRSHHYATGGIFTITVTVLDEDGGVSAQSTSTAVVAGVGLINGTLYIIGTEGRDHINIDYKQNQGLLKVDVKLNQGGSDCDSDDDEDDDDDDNEQDNDGDRIRRTFQISSVNRIVAYLLGGNDHYNGDLGSDGDAASGISQFVFGGAGDDHIKGGSGSDVLIGGSGDDDIHGGSGRDILIGGTGQDKLKGNAGNDLLIGGSAANENYLTALDQALADWVTGSLTATLFDLGTITDDNRKDDLFGEQGNDTLIGGSGDKLKQ